MIGWLWRRFGPKTRLEVKSKMQTFRYMHQAHPFDDTRYFTIVAVDVNEADEKAKQHMARLFEAKKTVMIDFYRCRS